MQDKLAALVGSRICHDLISPISAIGNGVELLGLTAGDTSVEMTLINDAVQNANARIRFFRISFGAAAADQMVGHSDITSILADLSKGGRLKYDWQAAGDQPRQVIRAIFLLLQCFETALPLGGTVAISHDDGWKVSVKSDRVKIDDALWSGLRVADPAYQHSAAQVQFALLPDMMKAAGLDLHVDLSSDAITARF